MVLVPPANGGTGDPWPWAGDAAELLQGTMLLKVSLRQPIQDECLREKGREGGGGVQYDVVQGACF